jgi:phosphate transport system substrate-binding protein
MHILMLRLAALLVSAFVACLPPVASSRAADLTVGGTGAATELLRRLGDAFSKQGEAQVDVVPSLGSSGGIRALADGVLDVAVSGRPLKPAEVKQGMAVPLVLRTLFIFATSNAKPNGLTMSQLADAYATLNPVWADGTPIKIVLRPPSDSDSDLMAQLFPGLGSAVERARKRPDVPVAATDQDNLDVAEQLPGSLSASTLTQILLEKRKLRAIAINGVEPTLDNFERGDYPYGKKLYFVVPAKPTPVAERFIAFLRSAEGRAILWNALLIL